MQNKDPNKMTLIEIADVAGNVGLTWAKWKHIADRYDRGEKSLLASLELEARTASKEKLSETHLERLALADGRYK